MKTLEQKLNSFVVDVEKALDSTVITIAISVLRSASKAIRTPSQGKKYGSHLASKEGDAPNTDTGRLLGSIKINHKRGSQEAEVGTNLDYGAELELVKNRPWLEPALDENIGNFEKQLEKVIELQILKAAE